LGEELGGIALFEVAVGEDVVEEFPSWKCDGEGKLGQLAERK
jgi:hypothetical protein